MTRWEDHGYRKDFFITSRERRVFMNLLAFAQQPGNYTLDPMHLDELRQIWEDLLERKEEPHD